MSQSAKKPKQNYKQKRWNQWNQKTLSMLPQEGILTLVKLVNQVNRRKPPSERIWLNMKQNYKK